VTMTTRRQRMVAAILLADLLDLTANYLAAHVLLPVGPFLIPGGTFVFALGFTELRRESPRLQSWDESAPIEPTRGTAPCHPP